MITVVKPYLPCKKKYKKYIDNIYASGWVTNNGPLVQELEMRLQSYLGVKNIVLVANGTVALETAYRALEIQGDAITTPFSYVATTSSLAANGIQPIYADIDPHSLNIAPNNIEKSITENSRAIVPVHVFGNACEVEEIERIARKNNLKVIYDAAHAFGVDYKGKSILNYGDISTLSFHATKLFHTVEGGALIINDDSLVQKVRNLINFGIESAESIPSLGTNAKMNEFEAAMGLCVLDEIDVISTRRETIYNLYKEELGRVVNLQVQNKDGTSNYSYFPVIFKNEEEMFKVQGALNKSDIFPRRYFFPSLDTLNCVGKQGLMVHSRDVVSKILCLPIYPDLNLEDQKSIIKIIKDVI